jgi:hypothetical protein
MLEPRLGRIIFFPLKFIPADSELVRLNHIQGQIDGWRAYLVTEWNRKNFTTGERYLSKQNFHNGIRAQWKMISGEKNSHNLESSAGIL